MGKKIKKYEFPKGVFETLNTAIKKNPTWSFNIADVNVDKWSFFKNCDENVLLQLKSYEGMTWAEIEKVSGGKNKGTNNHFIKINELIKEAQQEIRKLKALDDKIFSLFSLRLEGKVRIYGIRDEDTGLFKIVWLDMEHEIYHIVKQ